MTFKLMGGDQCLEVLDCSLQMLGFFQLLGDQRSFVRESTTQIVNSGQVSSIMFMGNIPGNIPNLLRSFLVFIAGCFCQFHIGSKLALFDQFADSLGGILPGDNLRCPGIPGRFTTGKPHPIFTEPSADFVAVKIQTVGTMVDLLHEINHVFHGLVL